MNNIFMIHRKRTKFSQYIKTRITFSLYIEKEQDFHKISKHEQDFLFIEIRIRFS